MIDELPLVSLRDVVPKLYSALLPLDLELPVEQFSTCSDCAMARRADARQPWNGKGARYFQAHIKCCTWHPTLPNYLVGGMLSEPGGDEGRCRILEAIRKRVGISPAGLAPSRLYAALYEKARSLAFGNSEKLLCPFFERTLGRCTVWKHREAVCTTFHCKHAGGRAGQETWMTLKRLLMQVQDVLARHCVLESGLSSSAAVFAALDAGKRQLLTTYDLDEAVNDAEYGRIWAEAAGREAEFFVKCYERVRSLKDLEGIGGVGLKTKVVAMRRSAQDLMRLPPKLVWKRGVLGATSDTLYLPGLDCELTIASELAKGFHAGMTVEAVTVDRTPEEAASIKTLLWVLYRHGMLEDADAEAP